MNVGQSKNTPLVKLFVTVAVVAVLLFAAAARWGTLGHADASAKDYARSHGFSSVSEVRKHESRVLVFRKCNKFEIGYRVVGTRDGREQSLDVCVGLFGASKA